MNRDDDNWIVDKYDNTKTYDRKSYGYWTGDVRRATYVHPLGASLTSPPPPFTGFGEPGELPGRQSGTDAGPGPERDINVRPVDTTCTTDTSASSSDGRSRNYYEPPAYQEERLHQEVYSSMHRSRDGGSRYKYGYRDDRDLDERDRIRDTRRTYINNDRTHARDAQWARNHGMAPHSPYPPASVRDARCNDADKRRVESPDLSLAPRGRDGHPLSPWALLRLDSEYEVSDDSEEEDPDYIAEEEKRIERARVRPRSANSQPPALRTRDSRLEAWEFRDMSSILQARNLAGWIAVAQTGAYEKMGQIINHASARPLDFRSEGDAYIIRNQKELERTYWTAATGGPRLPRAVRHPNTSDRRTDPNAREMHVDDEGPRQGPFTFGSTQPIRQPNLNAAPNAPLTVGLMGTNAAGTLVIASITRVYLGASEPDPKDVHHAFSFHRRPNTRNSTQDGMRYYSGVTSLGWPHGFLTEGGKVPSGAFGERPRRGDMRGYHTHVALGPVSTRKASHQSHLWYCAAHGLFSIGGLFAYIVTTGGYERNVLPMDHFAGPADNVSFGMVAAWYYCHGVFPGTQDVEELEAFSCARRNIMAKIPNLDNTSWNDVPRSYAEAIECIVPPWSEIQNSLLADALLAFPAPTEMDIDMGINGSAHAPGSVNPTTGLKGTMSSSGIIIVEDPVDGFPPPPPDSPSSQNAES
ncbi:hypothetical protein DFH07DRAFT_972423 [Mycena maculata]|uniref:Uncharacterized protein n=1 Tax=Mycena maculata TaxID=230809 RepID=A0AAD7MKL7_9AGAR|nr:hypothetical protein DFH07DRAFT_972423 [Mycena maculata]